MSKGIEKIAYKPVGMLLGIAAGPSPGLFRQVWKLTAGDGEAPNATDEDRGWGEILAAAALQGAIFAVVRAAVDRGGAVGVRRITGAGRTDRDDDVKDAPHRRPGAGDPSRTSGRGPHPADLRPSVRSACRRISSGTVCRVFAYVVCCSTLLRDGVG